MTSTRGALRTAILIAAFVTLQGRNRVVTIDLDSGKIVGWAPTGVWSDGIAFSRIITRP